MISASPPRAELIGGQRFTRPERTPFLRAIVDRAKVALEAELRLVAPDAQILRDRDVLLSVGAVAIPDLAIYRSATFNVPDIIIEYRAESTDRLFYGPKRLAYARACVPEVWFVDVGKATLTALRLSDALDYPWPARTYTRNETIHSSALPNLTLPVDMLSAVEAAPRTKR